MIIFIVNYFYRLKIGDICLIMRNLCVKDGLANNTRVQILDISPLRIRCQTLGDHPKSIVLPRIRFNFRLPYGQSFTMTRLQFPLRRAYCMSIHKSQGQTLGRVLVDARAGFFAHGQAYVAASRVTHFRDIGFCLTSEQLCFDRYRFVDQSICQDGKPMLFNIVYQEAIAELAAIQDADIVAAAHAGGSV